MTVPLPRQPSHGVLRSFRHFNYRLWFAGALVSNVGTWMQRTAQDWLVLTELTHHDPRAVGVVMALQFGPQFVLLPWTGYAADRFDRRTLLIVTQTVMGALSLVLGIFTVIGLVRLWEVYAFALLFGVAAAFDTPVRQTFVGELVGDADFANAAALNSASFNAARTIGPAIAGLCIGAFGTGWTFIVNGFSYLAVLASLAALRRHDLRNSRPACKPSNVFEGFRYVASQPVLRVAAAMLFLIGTFGLNFPIIISIMAVSVFHTDAAHYGMLSSALALGTIAGALLTVRWDTPRFAILTRAGGAFALGCALAAVAPGYWLFAVALTLTGVAALIFLNTSNSLMQLTSAPGMRGRVMAIRLAIAFGSTPIGAPFVGWVAYSFGPRWALGVAALAGLLAMFIGLLHARASRMAPDRPSD